MYKVGKHLHILNSSGMSDPYHEDSKVGEKNCPVAKGSVSFLHGSRLRTNKHKAQVVPLPIRRCLPPPATNEDNAQFISGEKVRFPAFAFSSIALDDSDRKKSYISMAYLSDGSESVSKRLVNDKVLMQSPNLDEYEVDQINREVSLKCDTDDTNASQTRDYESDDENIEYNYASSDSEASLSLSRKQHGLQRVYLATKGKGWLEYKKEEIISSDSIESENESEMEEQSEHNLCLTESTDSSECGNSEASNHHGRGVDLLLDAISVCQSNSEVESGSNNDLVRSNNSSNNAIDTCDENEDDDTISSCDEYFIKWDSIIESDDIAVTLEDIDDDESEKRYYNDSIACFDSKTGDISDTRSISEEFQKSLVALRSSGVNVSSNISLGDDTKNETTDKSISQINLENAVPTQESVLRSDRYMRENVLEDYVNNEIDVSDQESLLCISEALEFDYWNHQTLSVIASLFRRRFLSQVGIRRFSFPIQIPSKSDIDFWVNEVLSLVDFEIPGFNELLSQGTHGRIAVMVHDLFAAELDPLDVSLVPYKEDSSKNVEISSNISYARECYVGSLTSAESRLALGLLNIKHVFIIDSYPTDELWSEDGIRYTAHVLPSSDDANPKICDIIEACALEVVSLLFENKPHEHLTTTDGGSILIACETGNKYASAVAATVLTKSLNIDMSSAVKVMRQCRSDMQVEPSWLPPTWLFIGSPDAALLAPRTKRIFSYPKISSLLKDTPDSYDSPKRARCKSRSDEIPSISLGEAATISFPCFNFNNIHVPSDDNLKDGDCDDDTGTHKNTEYRDEGSNSFLPLFTPPVSPKYKLTVVRDDEISGPLFGLSQDSIEKCNELSVSVPDFHEEEFSSQDNTGLTPRLSSLNFQYL